jgi:hypothetical protein
MIWTSIDLTPWLDCRAITAVGERARGGLSIWGNSLPAEQVPRGSRVLVGQVPFDLAAGDVDHIRCARQLVPVPTGRYDWLYLLAAAERRSEDPVYLHFDDGAVDPEWLRVSDFWPETRPRFGERPAFACDRLHYPRHTQPGFGPTVWRQRVAVPREAPLAAIRLPDNPAIHIFALTAARAALDERAA